jgi:hypothetical protein
MQIYKIESQEVYQKLREILAGIAFFRFDPVDGYFVKMYKSTYQQLEKQGITLKQINYE